MFLRRLAFICSFPPAVPAAAANTTNQSPLTTPSLEQARASTLNSLHLRLAVHRPPEPLRQLVAVPELALLRLHAAKLSRSTTTNTAVGLETTG